MERPEYKWLALHIFYSGNANELLTVAIKPFIDQWKSHLAVFSPWFFIRYWEGGSHIRLRLNADLNFHEQIVKSGTIEFFNLIYPTFKIEKVLIVEYVPELTRYGNAESMPWAEKHFAASSAYVLNWLGTKKDEPQITLQAIQLHLLLLFCSQWPLEKLIQVSELFVNGWLPRLYRKELPVADEKTYWLMQFGQTFSKAKVTICLAAKIFHESFFHENLSDELANYKFVNTEMLHQYYQLGFQPDKLMKIISSMMHMTNNRLGISNQEEAYLMYVVGICLRYILQND